MVMILEQRVGAEDAALKLLCGVLLSRFLERPFRVSGAYAIKLGTLRA